MKRHALLMLCHDDPDHVLALITSLAGPNAKFFVHVDLKSDVSQFKALMQRPDVVLVDNRVKVYWGGWSQVQAALNSLAAARLYGDFDYFTLLSGQHFPLRSREDVFAYFDSQDAEFINITAVPNAALNKTMERFTRFHFEVLQRPMGRRMNILKHFSQMIPFRRRLANLQIYAGSQWWTLSAKAIAVIEVAIAERPNLARFFRFVHCPDESFFQTILGNYGFLDRCVRSPIYTDWSNPKEAPAYLRKEHLSELLHLNFRMTGPYGDCPAIFARKFGSRNREVVEEISSLVAGNVTRNTASRALGTIPPNVPQAPR